MIRTAIGALLITAWIGSAQQDPAGPTFSTRTELVQVSVIAEDKHGKPVTDLRRDEFQLLDNGVSQDVKLFVLETKNAEAAKSDAPSPEPLPPNTFSNRIADPAGAHNGYSVILIDSLYTDADPNDEEGSTLARVRTLQMLRSMPPGETIAIYAQKRKLQIICEFTRDRDLLERELRKWTPSPDTPENTMRAFSAQPSSLRMQQMTATRGDAAAEAARIDQRQRAAVGDSQIEAMADHLAGIPGRKKMIWLSNRFVIGPRALQKLNGAGVSIYPVDLNGVLGGRTPIRTMEDIAAFTGGVAYHGRNDLDIAIREAMVDGRVSYTLGFYPAAIDDNRRTATLHRLAVRSTRPGVTLRYGTSYEAGASRSANSSHDLVQALNRPIDASGIAIKAFVTRTRDRLDIEAALDVESLGLVRGNALWTGKIDVVARFTMSDGTMASNAFAQTVSLNLRQATYDKMLRGGLAYHNQLKIPARALEMKLLFANRASGRVGTLTIPLSQVIAGRTAAE